MNDPRHAQSHSDKPMTASIASHGPSKSWMEGQLEHLLSSLRYRQSLEALLQELEAN